MRSLVSIIFVFCLSLLSVNAQDNVTQAREAFEKGVAAVRVASNPAGFDRAASEFRIAVRLQPNFGRAWHNLGLALYAAGRHREAATSLRRYLGIVPGAPDRADVRRLVEEVQRRASIELPPDELLHILDKLWFAPGNCASFPMLKRNRDGRLSGLRKARSQNRELMTSDELEPIKLEGNRVVVISELDICTSAQGRCPRVIRTAIEIVSRSQIRMQQMASAAFGGAELPGSLNECVVSVPQPIYGPMLKLDQFKRGPLHYAIDERNYAEIKRLLAAGMDPDAGSSDATSPLTFAVMRNDAEAVRTLLEGGADPNAMSQYGGTPFDWAFGKWNLVRLMLRYGADAGQIRPGGRTYLHNPILAEAPSIADLLIAYGANPKAVDDNGSTPLHSVAGVKGGEALIRFFILRGLSPNTRNKFGITPFLSALSDVSDTRNASVMIDLGADLSARNEQGRTPLMETIQARKFAAAQLLLSRGTDPNVADKYGATALHFVAESREPSLELARLLLDNGARPNTFNQYGATPLGTAAFNGHAVLIHLFHEYGGDPDAARDYSNSIPLHIAASAGRLAAVQALVAVGADLTARDRRGLMPHETPEAAKFPAVVEYLRAAFSGEFVILFNRPGGFWTGEGDQLTARIIDGRYVIDHRKTGQNFHTFTSRTIDNAHDFELSAEMVFEGGDEDNFFGLIWARTGPDRFMFFGITANGRWAVRQWNNQWIELANGTSPDINKGFGANELVIFRRGADYFFLINGTEVGSLPFAPFTGNFGFHLNHTMKIAIERLSLSYLQGPR